MYADHVVPSNCSVGCDVGVIKYAVLSHLYAKSDKAETILHPKSEGFHKCQGNASRLEYLGKGGRLSVIDLWLVS